ncbi:nucleotidyltransferase family protein [Streptococcus chenjunshii]|uniref:Nucleotidyltransferase family protein n=1 Tax=Streptococcus chenjunshii TaxID=2173853 RepID=A0A372KL65_9STRE|nr:nucleotidyltransferase family protein [Streptococcus chenjunshii]AXQ79304.1 nucleotidyltransferase family protein [Streptococcus chenjunshii]RFU50883.1 nucleotidyltransferase family protein [Streptococcus chenjunshii]RFU53029.1 nucleotidyltransferase family protein [Streptococcus chenjunshii]
MTVKELLEKDSRIMTILEIIADLDLQDAWLCAGTLRNYIWQSLSDDAFSLGQTDVDVVFYDEKMSYEETIEKERHLQELYPAYNWELKNQVYMHYHSPHTGAYTSATDAIAKFPERCTAIGARLDRDKQLCLFLPYGEEDLLTFKIRPTPHFAQNADRLRLYKERLLKKDWQNKWPQLEIEWE